jgi:outer membrane lipoprotein SlyB
MVSVTRPKIKRRSFMRTVLAFFSILLLIGCAASRPTLYPNDHLKQVGNEQAQRDIDECRQMAGDYVKQNPGAEVAKDTLLGAAAGAAIGAVGGAVAGDAGTWAAAGAGMGATSGLIRGLFGASEPSPVYKQFVNRCLAERGYESLGW